LHKKDAHSATSVRVVTVLAVMFGSWEVTKREGIKLMKGTWG